MGAKRGVSRQDEVLGVSSEFGRPIFRLRGIGVDQLMTDRLCLDEVMRDDPAKEIIRATNAEGERFVSHQRIIGDEENTLKALAVPVERTSEVVPFDTGDRPGDGGDGVALVLVERRAQSDA